VQSATDSPCVVFLVDDQAMIGEAIRRMLAEEPDIEYHFCSDATAAVAEAIKVQPTVIIQDVVMPDRDGIALIQDYRAAPDIEAVPIMMLSTREDPRDKSRAFSAGASDDLVKIPDRIELVARIRAHSRSYLAQKQRDEAYRRLREMQAQLEASNLELQRISCQDGLTGIYNRRHFDTYLENEWARAARDGASIALILCDIDYFKPYNDHYGHQAGDDCLQRVAQVFRDVLQRPADLVARYGGEEFVVVLPHTEVDGAMRIAEAMRARVEHLALPHQYSKSGSVVTVSLGIAALRPSPKNRLQDLIALADRALYQAKQQGRNRSVQFASGGDPDAAFPAAESRAES
jgi:two-component system chemotaxis family response regulator WspR